MQEGKEQEERRAACRAAGRAVAAALLGFTLRRVAIVTATNEVGATKLMGAMALKERHASFEEEAFIDLAGTWAELDGVEFADDPLKAKSEIMGRFEGIYPDMDPIRTRFGLTRLIDDYRDGVRALVLELLQRRTLSGIECGKIIMASHTVSRSKM